MTRRRAGWPPGLWMVLGAYVAMGLLYSLLLPLGEAPDEPGHYNYARIVALEQRLPSGAEEHEAFQPPLYYWLASPFAGLVDPESLPLKANADFTLDPGGPANLLLHTSEECFPYAGWAASWHLVRLVSLVLGVTTAYGVCRLGWLASWGRWEVGLVAAALFCLAPQFTLVHGAASNDTLAVSLGVFLLLEASLIALGGCSRRRLVVAGVLWGLATLGKVSMLAAGAGLAGAVVLGDRRTGKDRLWARVAWDLLLLGLSAGLVSGWWFVLNTVKYGDPLGWQLIYSINQARIEPVDWLQQLLGLYRSYWLSYVGMALPSWLYWLLFVVPVASAAGFFLRRRQRQRMPCQTPIVVLLVVQVLAFGASWARWTLAVKGTDQARLLYPALAALAVLLALGLVAPFSPRQGRRVATMTVVLMLALNAYGLLGGVLPVFAPPRRFPLSEVPDVGATVNFGDRIELVAYRLTEDTTRDSTLTIETWWRLLAPVRDDVWLTIRLVDADGQTGVWKQGSPSGGRDTTDRWPQGPVTYGVHRLKVSSDVAAGVYTVEIGLRTFGEDRWWPVISDGKPIREVWRLGQVTVAGGRR